MIFDLPGYRVVEAVDLPCGDRRVVVAAEQGPQGCPGCGVVSTRVHAWTRQRVKDVPTGGDGTVGGGRVQVVVLQPRMVCAEAACGKRTFTQVTDQLPARARCLTRVRVAVGEAVIASGRSVAEVAAAFALAWWTVQAVLDAAVMTLPQVDSIPVRLLGIDEHRFRTVRFFRDEQGTWRRVEPWMTTFVDLATGQVLGVVDGRDSAAVSTWLASRSPAWRDRVEVVAIDPSAAFRSCVATGLPQAVVALDHWHLVALANLMLTSVRQRVAREQRGRRGRKTDLAWAHRMLLLRAGDRLSPAALHRLGQVLDRDDPTREIAAAWAVKERLRHLLACTDLKTAEHAWNLFGLAVLEADLPETDTLWTTVHAWRPEIHTLITTRVTNARTEAANTAIKHIKRTGRGYRNTRHYTTRILLRSTHQTRRRRSLTHPATTLNYG